MDRSADAQLEQDWETGPGWSFRLMPYLWMIGIKGDLATLWGVPPVEVDRSLADILDNLDLVFASFLEAGHLAFSILTVGSAVTWEVPVLTGWTGWPDGRADDLRLPFISA